MIKERPILFSGPMVRAILDGRKSQTRRVVTLAQKLEPNYRRSSVRWDKAHSWWEYRGVVHEWPHGQGRAPKDYVEEFVLDCPFGQPGDRLWVREAWCGHWGPKPVGWPNPDDAPKPCRSITDAEIRQRDGSIAHATPDNPLHVYYRATAGDTPPMQHLKWKPSIHMPRWACRLTLEVVGVRVERLCSISGVDAAAEGYPLDFPGGHHGAYARCREAFLSGEWAAPKRDANQWVWVVEFKR